VAPSFLLPDTLARENGQGKGVPVDTSSGGTLRITLGITHILEKESLHVSIWGSADGRHWERLTVFPPKSYCGNYALDLDLARREPVRMLRVEWSMRRWTAAARAPAFGFHVLAEEARMKVAAGAR